MTTVLYLMILVGVFLINSASRSRTWEEAIKNLGDVASAIITANPTRLREAIIERGTLAGDSGTDPAKRAIKEAKPNTGANGQLPDSALAPIPFATGKRLTPEAAADLGRLNEAYKAHFGRNMSVTDAYRTLAKQKELKAGSKAKLAATPGTSQHGWGKAVDLGGGINTFGSEEYVWMKLNAPAYGWNHPSWAEPSGSKPEPWHWEHA